MKNDKQKERSVDIYRENKDVVMKMVEREIERGWFKCESCV